MTESDIFWRLSDVEDINSQHDLYNRLSKCDHLEDVIYIPDKLNVEVVERKKRIEKKNFQRVSFSKTIISDIIFRNCIFEHCQFIGSTIKNCEFHSCKFVSTNTYKISILETYIDPLSFKRCLDQRIHQNIGVHLYQVLLKNSRDKDQIEFERDAQFFFLRWKRFQEAYEIAQSRKNMASWRDLESLQVPKRFRLMLRLIWEKWFGSGIRIRYFLVTATLAVLLAWTFNFIFRNELGLVHDEEIISTSIEALYFTTISLTTLGYGDIVPTTSFGRLVAAFQSIIGFFLFALLASMLFRKISP